MIEQLKDWWEGTSEREQRLSLIAGLVMLLVIIYFLLWQPLASTLEESQQRLNSTEQTLKWTETSINKLVAQGGNATKTNKRKQNLSRLINQTSKRNNINISRIQNQKNEVEIWVNNVEFTLFLRWLTLLKNEYNVHVVSVDISKQKEQGMVKINRLSVSY